MSLVPRGEINGLVDTSKSVWSNMQELARASAAWITNDIESNKWSVIINRPGTASMHFNDDNILGNVDVSMSSIKDMYNRVVVTYPNKELHDEYDHIDMRVAAEDMWPGETENTLNVRLECVNDQVQARSIAGRELKQSRVDQVVEFATDYRASGIKAGAIISISNSVYAWDHKLWRVMRVEENDDDDGTITLNITAFEYDLGVYDESDLEVVERTVKTGIVPRSMNTAIAQNTSDAATNALNYTGVLALLNQLLGSQFTPGTALTGGNAASTAITQAYVQAQIDAELPVIIQFLQPHARSAASTVLSIANSAYEISGTTVGLNKLRYLPWNIEAYVANTTTAWPADPYADNDGMLAQGFLFTGRANIPGGTTGETNVPISSAPHKTLLRLTRDTLFNPGTGTETTISLPIIQASFFNGVTAMSITSIGTVNT